MHASPVLDPQAAAVVERLHALSDRQIRAGLASFVFRSLLEWIRGGRADFTQTPQGKRLLSDKLVALDRDKAELCYLLCRALHAHRVVEAGTSFGVSTIYLTSAVRDNAKAGTEIGIVIGTEHEPSKAAAARANFADAGVEHFVELREGDLRETLKNVEAPVDFMLVDIWIPMARPALELVMPKLRPVAIVLCDNITQYERQYADYLSFVRTPSNAFRSTTLPMKGGLEMSVRI